MIEKAFENLKSRALLDWGVILLGVHGALGNATGQLSGLLVESFATSQIETAQPGELAFDAIAALALDANLHVDERRQLVESICQAKGVDTALSMRKWRAALIEDAFHNIESNPIYGHIQLSEIWSKWEWPDDAPPSMRKGAEVPSSFDFGSPAAFSQAKQEVEDWLSSEFSALEKMKEQQNGNIG